MYVVVVYVCVYIYLSYVTIIVYIAKAVKEKVEEAMSTEKAQKAFRDAKEES